MKKVAMLAVLIAIGLAAPASATTTLSSMSSPFIGLDPAGATLHLGLGNIPVGHGLYITEAAAPVTGVHATSLNSATTIWVSESAAVPNFPAPLSPTKSDVKIKVAAAFIDAKGASIDCQLVICGLYFRMDHTAPGDTSEDQFFPISFKAGIAAPVLVPDTISAAIDGTPLSTTTPGRLTYRAPLNIAVLTGSGAAATILSSTPDCAVSGNSITALKGSGICDFAITSPGNTAVAGKTSHFPFVLNPGIQSVRTLPKSIKIGHSIDLDAKTNFGENSTYKIGTSSTCVLVGTKITGKKAGTCTILIKAPGTANYPALAGSISAAITK